MLTTPHILAKPKHLHFSDLAEETFFIESMAEADASRVTNQQLEYPYGTLCFLITLQCINIEMLSRVSFCRCPRKFIAVICVSCVALDCYKSVVQMSESVLISHYAGISDYV